VKKYFLTLSLELTAVEVNDCLHSSMTGGKICFHHFGRKKRQTLESMAKYCPRKPSKITLKNKYMGTPIWAAEGRILVEFSSTLLDLPTISKAEK
jgi:hypothetical protein